MGFEAPSLDALQSLWSEDRRDITTQVGAATSTHLFLLMS
jgi:hypothetical protein